MPLTLGASRRRLAAVLSAGVLALGAAAVFASHGGNLIDLTSDNEIVTHDGAIYAQGGVGAGTGTFDPFLTLSTNDDTEKGYNVCDEAACPSGEFDTFDGSDRTHELLVSAVPLLEYPAGSGQFYREFSLDANDQGADTWMSIEQIKIFVDNESDLTGYDDTSETFASDDDLPTADKIFDMDDGSDQTILLVTQGLESGSGVSDITVLVPEAAFPADCAYGSTDCDQYLIFYTSAGGYTGDSDVDCGTKNDPDAPCDWNVTAGFEEWRVRFLPVVNVSKTAEESKNLDYPWTIDKTVTPTTINLFDGAPEADVDWSITPTRGTPTESGWKITGTITISNPTGSSPIPKAIPASIESIEDLLSLGGPDIPVAVDCPDIDAFPYVLGAGETIECTYEYSPPDSDGGTNTAYVEIDSGIPAGDGGIEFGDTVTYDASAPVDFSTATTTSTNETATVTDPLLDIDQTAVSGQTITVDGGYSCPDDEGQHDNTATVTPDDGGTPDTDDASVVVNCYQLSVSKTVEESLTRNYTWTIDKSVTPTTINLFDGAPEADVDWTITPTRSGPSDSGWAVTGTITITNPAPIAATGVAVTDLIEHATLADVSATVDCSASPGNQGSIDVPANSNAQCSYSATLSNGDDRTNTATATLFEIGYDSDPVDIDFSTATVTETNESATVTDPLLGVDEAAVSGQAITVDGGYSCPDDEGQHDNTATVTPNDGGPADTDDATVVVNCYELSVEKDATTTYSRDYDWSIAKTRFIAEGEDDGDGDPSTLTLDEGQTFDVSYRVTVTMTGFTDDDHAVSGTITISNPAPMEAVGVAVTDVISHDTEADITDTHVDCDEALLGDQGTVDVPAADNGTDGTATCEYWADLPNDDDRTNTATATLFGEDYDGTAPITFDPNNPTEEIDECIDVSDPQADPSDLGTVCLGDLDTSDEYEFEYVVTVGPYAVCGLHDFTNTATYVTTDDDNDTDETDDATYTIHVDVPCPQGCTLTQGYWKTHNDTFHGGAPTDETWQLIGPLAENETFFLSEQTYYEVMWTAPKGNAYYNLAHQYIAAILNELDGAAVPANVQDAIDDATALFEAYTPAQVATYKGKTGKAIRAEFITLAGLLGSYNEGLIGPGHCDEDPSSAAFVLPPLLPIRRRRLMA